MSSLYLSVQVLFGSFRGIFFLESRTPGHLVPMFSARPLGQLFGPLGPEEARGLIMHLARVGPPPFVDQEKASNQQFSRKTLIRKSQRIFFPEMRDQSATFCPSVVWCGNIGNQFHESRNEERPRAQVFQPGL